MVKLTTQEKVIAIICGDLGFDPKDVTMDTKLSDLDMDSLDMLEIVCKLEDALNLKRLDLSLHNANIETVGQIVEAVIRNVG